MMIDTVQTARDLLALFPIVRRIEAERIALELDRFAEVVPTIQDHASAISNAAAQSAAVTQAAGRALRQNDPAINDAYDPLLRTSLVADKLLVIRNFIGAVGSKVSIEISDLSAKSWQAFKVGLPEGIETAARIGPLMALATVVAGSAGVLAATLPAFKSVAGLFYRKWIWWAVGINMQMRKRRKRMPRLVKGQLRVRSGISDPILGADDLSIS